MTSAQNAGTDCTEYWGNTYGYDAWGNLLSKTVTKCSAENMSVAVAANNQLQNGYLYDAAGNMAHDATAGLNYTFDQENRITGAGGFTYTYDADGNRVEKSNGSTGTLYWYMSPGIVAESDLGGNLQSEYVFFDGERMARRDLPGGAVSYYFSDHLKTTDIVTDAQGNIKNESDFYPWGGELQFAANDSNHYKFTGKERDSETGLDYFGARYYSNGLGRFITPDWSAVPVPVPYADLSDPQSLNQYSYVRNIPTVKVDADGHDGGVGVLPSLEEVAQALKEIEAASAGGGAGVSFSAILTGAAIVLGPVMVKPDILPGGHVGQFNAEEMAEKDRVDAENAQTLGQARGAGEEHSQSDDARDKARTNGGLVKGEDFSPSAKRDIDARDGNKCQKCGRDVRSVQNKKGEPTPPDQRQRHHIKPKSEGGNGKPENGKTLCPECHKEEHRRLREEKKNQGAS